jgi:hypothetical protein
VKFGDAYRSLYGAEAEMDRLAHTGSRVKHPLGAIQQSIYSVLNLCA